MFAKQAVWAVLSRFRIALIGPLVLSSVAALLLSDPRPQIPRGVAATPSIPAEAVPATSISPTGKSHILASYSHVPVSFEPNQGQSDSRVKFLARGHGYTLFLTPSGAVLSLPVTWADSRPEIAKPKSSAIAAPHVSPSLTSAAVLRMQLLGARQQPVIRGEQPLSARTNYFIGDDPRKWRTNVLQFSRVSYGEVYPGIDLTFHGASSQLEFDFLVNPGARPDAIALKFSGARELHTSNSGDLVLASAAGDVHLHRPVAYQEVDGVRRPVEARFQLKGRDEVAFVLGDYDRRRQLVIDPTLGYSNYLGGSAEDEGFGIAVDSSGNAYVTGQTMSANFPGASGAPKGNFDAFVTQLNSSGVVQFTSLIGGSNADAGLAVAVDSAGIYVVGSTQSSDFPATAGSAQPAFGGGTSHGFAANFALNGLLTWATFLGGTGVDVANGLAVDGSHNLYVGGDTFSSDFQPVVLAQTKLFTTFNNGAVGSHDDGFVAKISADGTKFLFSTYLGGTANDAIAAIALDPFANIYVTGTTLSSDFPTQSPFQPTCGSCTTSASDAFVTEIKADGSALVYSTFLGGSGEDAGTALAVDFAGEAFVTGQTQSGGPAPFPTNKPFTTPSPGGGSLVGLQNAFVTKVAAGGTSLVYSSYLGGSGTDSGLAIAMDNGGNAYVTGLTNSANFPSVSPTQLNIGGSNDAFVTVVKSDGSSLLFSTFLGGPQSEDSVNGYIGGGIAVDPRNNIYVAGSTQSTSGFTGTLGGVSDAFTTAFTPAATQDFGISPGAFNSNPVTQGFSTSLTVTVSSINGFTGPVNLTCLVMPSGPPCGFKPASVTPPAGGSASSTLTVVTTASTPARSYSIKITGTSGLLGHSVTTALSVTPPLPTFSLQASAPSPSSITAGSSATTNITVNSQNGFNSAVTLTCGVSPSPTAAPTCSFSPAAPTLTANGSVTSVLTINTTAPTVAFAAPAIGRRSRPFFVLWLPIPGLALLGVGLCSRRPARRKSLALLLGLFLFLGLAFQVACGGSSNPSSTPVKTTGGTPTNSYTISISGSSTNGVQTGTSPAVTLVVQ